MIGSSDFLSVAFMMVVYPVLIDSLYDSA